MHDMFFYTFYFHLAYYPPFSMGGSRLGLGASLFVATRRLSSSSAAHFRQTKQTHKYFFNLTIFDSLIPTVQCCFERRENPQHLFRCISGHWSSSDSFRALPKPANGKPVGSQIFKPPTPDLRGMPLRLAQTNGVCLNQ